MVKKTKTPKLNKKNNDTKKDLFSIGNMDDLVKEDKINAKDNQIDPLLPRHPFRMLICGASGTGKSNLALQILYKPLVVYDRLYVFSSMIDQPKYKFLKRHLDLLDEMVAKECDIKQKTIMTWETELEKIENLMDVLDTDFKNLVVIDDYACQPDKKVQKIIDNLFTRIRHKNTSIMMLSQLMYRDPCSRAVRNNLSHVILYNNYNATEVQLLSREYGSDLPRMQFKKLYNYILSEKYAFMLIDNTATDRRMRYRRNFDGVYKGPLAIYDANYFRPKHYTAEDEEEDKTKEEDKF